MCCKNVALYVNVGPSPTYPVLASSRAGPTLKALQKVALGKSRLIGTPPRVKRIANKANPVRVPQRARIGQPFDIEVRRSDARTPAVAEFTGPDP